MKQMLLRQGAHIAGFSALGVLSLFIPLAWYLLGVATLMCVAALLVAIPNSVGTWFLRTFERGHESIFPGKGVILGLLGVFLASLAFPQHRLAAHLVLAWADAASTIVGSLVRSAQLLWSYKSAVGFLTFIVVASGILSFFSPLGIVAAILLAIIESIDYRYFIILDDNLLLPLATGALLTIL